MTPQQNHMVQEYMNGIKTCTHVCYDGVKHVQEMRYMYSVWHS